MRIALVTTTINVPHVLRLYRRCDPDVRFFIAADRKSPIDCYDSFCNEIGNATWFMEGATEKWRCSDLIGWNCIQRRNIATLEALKWGAEIIVFVDDDNIPVDLGYFESYRKTFDHGITWTVAQDEVTTLEIPWHGLLASPEVPWFDIGQFLYPRTPHRGYPAKFTGLLPRLSHVVDARIGVCAGIVLGDPDTTAEVRHRFAPHVLHASPLLNAGIATNPRHTRTVFNTQNSAVLRELAPAMLLCPQFRRYDDIVASLVCQRVMAETGHHVLFGPPFVYQERNAHDIERDLADEQWGQANILRVQEVLWEAGGAGSIQNIVENCYLALDELMPGAMGLAQAWLEDCAKAMS